MAQEKADKVILLKAVKGEELSDDEKERLVELKGEAPPSEEEEEVKSFFEKLKRGLRDVVDAFRRHPKDMAKAFLKGGATGLPLGTLPVVGSLFGPVGTLAGLAVGGVSSFFLGRRFRAGFEKQVGQWEQEYQSNPAATEELVERLVKADKRGLVGSFVVGAFSGGAVGAKVVGPAIAKFAAPHVTAQAVAPSGEAAVQPPTGAEAPPAPTGAEAAPPPTGAEGVPAPTGIEVPHVKLDWAITETHKAGIWDLSGDVGREILNQANVPLDEGARLVLQDAIKDQMAQGLVNPDLVHVGDKFALKPELVADYLKQTVESSKAVLDAGGKLKVPLNDTSFSQLTRLAEWLSRAK